MSDNEEIAQRIAEQLQLPPRQVAAVIDLLDQGNTLPFIARYRKEATGGCDETALRAIEDAVGRLRELVQRKQSILSSLLQQGVLTDPLRRRIEDCWERQELEDLYLPYKPKRKTKATVARERGLEPLAELLLRQRRGEASRESLLKSYVNAAGEVPDAASAVQGACDILAERWSEHADVRAWLMEQALGFGAVVAHAKRGRAEEARREYETCLDRREAVRKIPSHRLLAMLRGETEGLLRVEVALDDEFNLRRLKQQLVADNRLEFHDELTAAVEDCYRRLLAPAIQSAVLKRLKEEADREAIAVFAKNLRDLLLAPPAGRRVTLGLDPGFRTGCKAAVVDGTGKFLATATIYPTPPRNDTVGAAERLKQLIQRHGVELIAIGNGTASRETEAFVREFLRREQIPATAVVVSEAGASVYSASELAAEEYPDLDVTVRGAISIAHRLQDPLSELVKIDPKSIGVGQYQHDVNQAELRKSLDREVESCVNLVGVDVNLASSALLSHVAGIGPRLAESIVHYRDQHGGFEQRRDLLQVPKLGRKAFEQAAGFLRIAGGPQPLDNSAVHPESYYVVEQMAKSLRLQPAQLAGNARALAGLDPGNFVDERVGLPTVQDILQELLKPGRDPRAEFRVARFADDIREVSDLKPGMILEGAITNVTRFGAFCDVGVHQDGLIHISQLAHEFVRDPAEVVSVGDVVRVKVLEVDVERNRISLSRKLD